jgi:hypothetical protein
MCTVLLPPGVNPIAVKYVSYQIDKNEMGRACSTCGEREEAYTGFWCGNLKERDNLEDPGLDGRIILTF